MVRFGRTLLMSEQIHGVDDVFGVNRDLPLNYVVRENVD